MDAINEETEDISLVPPDTCRQKSDVWNIFEKVEVVISRKKVPKSKCGICGQLLSRGPTSGTNHLSRHIKRHASAHGQSEDIRGQMQIGMNAAGNISNFHYDKKVARKEVVDYIIRAEQPFTFVEKHDFKGMIQRGFTPQYTGFSASTCKRDVMKLFHKGKDELIKFFENYEGKVCLTSDVWSSRQKMGYMSLTAHFIDKDWSLNKRIICFKMIEYPHTGESLAHHICEELISWHVHDKIFPISLDNATNNDVVVELLPDYLMIESVPRKLFHVRCCAHVLNLIVQDGLSILSPSIDKITTIVRSMNSSIKRHELWVQCCSDLGFGKKNIDNDVPHRWNSTYDLLLLALKHKGPLHRYVQKLNESRYCNLAVPTEQDWCIAELICSFLAIFNSSTKICCGVYSPTSSRVINCLVDIHHTFAAYSELSIFKDALAAMRTKFNKYWDKFPMVFCCATVMDPRFKLFAIEEWMKCIGIEQLEIDARISSIKTLLHQYYDIYKSSTVLPSAALRLPSDEVPTPLGTTSASITIPRVQNFSMQSLKKARVSSSSCTNSSDLQVYLDLATIEVDDDNHFSVLGWWKANQTLYPVLSLMARDLLSVPASTVASEAAFSAGGRVVSEKRAALSPNTIEALVCLKDWNLASKRMQDAAQEEEHAEELMNIRAARPDWMVDSEADGEDDSEGNLKMKLKVRPLETKNWRFPYAFFVELKVKDYLLFPFFVQE